MAYKGTFNASSLIICPCFRETLEHDKETTNIFHKLLKCYIATFNPFKIYCCSIVFLVLHCHLVQRNTSFLLLYGCSQMDMEHPAVVTGCLESPCTEQTQSRGRTMPGCSVCWSPGYSERTWPAQGPWMFYFRADITHLLHLCTFLSEKC